MIAELHDAWMNYYHASSIASTFHKGQLDKAGADYYQHPKRVAESILNDWDFDNLDTEERIFVIECATVGMLHDVLEDTNCTEKYLQDKGFSEDIIEGVKSVTRNETESYGDFIKRAEKNKYGKVVKLHDLRDNLDLTRLGKITEEDIPRINKYIKWYNYLNK